MKLYYVRLDDSGFNVWDDPSFIEVDTQEGYNSVKKFLEGLTFQDMGYRVIPQSEYDMIMLKK